MPTLDPRIDDYIAKSADFAQPILHHLRAIVHEACPEVEETIKWGFPHFMYKGMLCSMASFKAHCSFGFWQAKLLLADADNKTQEAMGQFGRITAVADLPSKKTLTGYIKQAMKLNTEPGKIPARARPAAAKAVTVPEHVAAALAADKKAQEYFAKFSPSQKREYLDWFEEAKTEATRQRRLAQAIEWIAEGKQRNWKYEKC